VVVMCLNQDGNTLVGVFGQREELLEGFLVPVDLRAGLGDFLDHSSSIAKPPGEPPKDSGPENRAKQQNRTREWQASDFVRYPKDDLENRGKHREDGQDAEEVRERPFVHDTTIMP